MISLSEIKEYIFKRKYSKPFVNLVYIVCIFSILRPIPFTAHSIYGKLYERFILGILLVIILNQLYIIITKKYRLPNLIINSNQITILKWFLMKYYTIEIQKIRNITELTLTWESIIEITLISNKRIRLSLNGYSDNDKELISNLFKVINANIKLNSIKV